MSDRDTIIFPAQPPRPEDKNRIVFTNDPEDDKRKKQRGPRQWIIPTSIGIGSFILGIMLGAGGSASSKVPPPSITTVPGPTVTVPGPASTTATVTAPAPAPSTTTVTLPPTTVTAPAPPPVTVPAQPAAPKVSFSDGQYEVGVDVQPGKYKTTTPAETVGRLCYLDIQDANDNYKAQEVTDKGFTIITIKPEWKGSIVTSSDCGDWAKVG